jgi:hypothetical protein
MRKLLSICSMVLAGLCLCAPARGDVGLVLNSSMNDGSSFFSSAGHAAIYLSRVCPATPTTLRMCRPGEQGSVMSNYSEFFENANYEWNVVPVSVFLYGVEDPAEQPMYGSKELRRELQNRYRDRVLTDYCVSQKCRNNPDASWRDLVGATFVRTVYIFEVKTTVEQDEEFVAQWNARPNVSHYSGLRRNCADFAKDVLNAYFPHAVHSNRLNDFGLTSPKAVARSITHYADHHKQMELRVTRFSQLPSDIRRSDDVREGTEALFLEKKWLAPMLYEEPHALAIFAACYFLTGWFRPEGALHSHKPDATLEAVQLAGRPEPVADEAGLTAREQWAAYKHEFDGELAAAKREEVIASPKELNVLFKHLEKGAQPRFAMSGDMWMSIDEGDGAAVAVGDTPATMLGSGSDQEMAYKLLLARVNFVLHSRGKNREELPEFRQDWAMLQTAEIKMAKERSRALEAATAPTSRGLTATGAATGAEGEIQSRTFAAEFVTGGHE